MKTKCRSCSLLKEKIKSEREPTHSRWVYRDENGKRWSGRLCPSCKEEYSLNWRRDNGYLPIDEVLYSTTKKGRMAEKTVQTYFEQMGAIVKITKTKGPDLLVKLGNKTFTVEVKSASPNGTGWRIAPVSDLRKNDDFLAIVFPDNRIHIEFMKDHLSKVSSSGVRGVTSLLKTCCCSVHKNSSVSKIDEFINKVNSLNERKVI